MKYPETRINELCTELGISRQTLYKHLTPEGALRPLGQKLLDKRKEGRTAKGVISMTSLEES
jgi:transcriptional antiterminator